MLACNCRVEGVQEQAARALANLAAHGDSNNNNNADIGKEAGALEALVQLIRSPHDGVRQEAAGSLWNFSFDDRNQEAIAAAGGVQEAKATSAFKAQIEKLQQERDEFQKMVLGNQQVSTQQIHEMKKKEKEYMKLQKEGWQRLT